MSARREPRTARRAAPLLVLALLLPTHGAASSGLQPFQMARSLQLVQDRIADGDHAALPMQRRLIEMIDARLRDAGPELFEDERNFHALMIYGMSGGNPATFAGVVSRLPLADDRDALASGVNDYLRGRPGPALETLRTLELAAMPPTLAAFVALVKGSVMATEDPEQAVALLDRARLLSPGTLVEEAALRRSISLHARAGDADSFMRAANQYARRFLRSPYASQFAEALVSGLASMFEHVDRGAIADIIAWMSEEQARTIYLRLARQAAIDGNDGLLAFASAKARQINGERRYDDPRVKLYSSIASVTSETVEQVLDELSRLDRDRLSAADRALLKAAEAIAREVVTRPTDISREERDTASADGPDPRPAGTSDDTGPLDQVVETDELGTDSLVTSARQKLEAIDEMLREGAR